VSAGAGGAGVVAHLDLVPPPEPSLTLDPVAHRKRQVEYAMTLPDEASQRLPDGTLAYVAHRTVRDGARVGLIHIPELLRFDVHPRADCFSFTVRNLTGLPAVGPARELPVRPYHRPVGVPLNEYELQLTAPGGRDVWIVVRIPPYLGELENEYSAVALVR
jgi:hypothetical protein